MTDSYFNATSVFFNGCGILITGKSGSGKSSLALALMERGARLISDDMTCLHIRDYRLIASAPENIKGVLEVRGLGLLSLSDSIVDSAQIDMLIELVETQNERCPLDMHFVVIQGVRIPLFQFKMFEFALTNKVIMAIKLLKNEVAFFNKMS